MNILMPSFSFPVFEQQVYDGKFVFTEAIAYAQNGANVIVVTPHMPGSKRRQKIRETFVVDRFRYFFPEALQVAKQQAKPVYRPTSFLAIIQLPLLCLVLTFRLLQLARWTDIIHAQWTFTALLALPAKWFMKKKIVMTARGSDLRLLPRWVNRFIHRRVDASIDCFGPQSFSGLYRKEFPGRFIKLPVLVETPSFGSIPKDIEALVVNKNAPLIILYVGRFDPIKLRNDALLLTLIHSSSVLKSKGVNFHVIYVGDGDKRIKGEMFRLIRKLDLSNEVTMVGPRTNVLDYMKYCHVGVGGAAFNAVSQEFTISGKPQILVTNQVNSKLPLKDGVSAIFVKPDDPIDLSEKLIWAANNGEQLGKMGERAKMEMADFIEDSLTGGKRYLEAFERLINNEKEASSV